MHKKEDIHLPSRVKNFEQQLQEYQKRITNILESFTDAFFEVDLNWTVTYWNLRRSHSIEVL